MQFILLFYAIFFHKTCALCTSTDLPSIFIILRHQTFKWNLFSIVVWIGRVKIILCEIFREIDRWGSWWMAFFHRGALVMKQWVHEYMDLNCIATAYSTLKYALQTCKSSKLIWKVSTMYALQIMETQYSASKFTCKNPKPSVISIEITYYNHEREKIQKMKTILPQKKVQAFRNF